MNNFTVTINGVGVEAVFPLNMGLLLDERLDEGYLTVYTSSAIKHYKPTSKVKILFEDKELNFVVGNDESNRCPVGSARIKHELYLIEETKVLEGIISESTALTNALSEIAGTDIWVE